MIAQSPPIKLRLSRCITVEAFGPRLNVVHRKESRGKYHEAFDRLFPTEPEFADTTQLLLDNDIEGRLQAMVRREERRTRRGRTCGKVY